MFAKKKKHKPNPSNDPFFAAMAPFANTNNTGTGYGGNQKDTSLLKAGRKKAEKSSYQEDKTKAKFLKDTLKAIQKLSIDDEVQEDERIKSTLADVFRNQIPSDWGGKRRELYEAALDLAQELSCEQHIKLLGDADEADSVLYWLVDFGNQAEQILRHEATVGSLDGSSSVQRGSKRGAIGREDDSVLFASKVKLARDKAVQMAKKYNIKPEEELTMISFAERYQGELGPMRFDTVEQMSNIPIAPSTLDTRKLFKELAAYRSALPIEYASSCFCRVINNRLDLLRVMITGPDESPYANGCFFFDVSLPAAYPQVAPKVQFLTTGGGKIRFNPNLYNCGKVCLSLLGTWSGPGWISGQSTLLQVLVSIQSLILVPDPYFNEPGWEQSRGTPRGDNASKSYNANIRKHTIDASIKSHLTNILNKKNPYPEFEAIMIKHFLEKRSLIEVELKSWSRQDSRLQKDYRSVLDLFARLAAREKESKRVSKPKQPLPYAHVGSKSTEPIELDSDVEEMSDLPKIAGRKSEEAIEIDLSDDDSVGKVTPKESKSASTDDIVDLT